MGKTEHDSPFVSIRAIREYTGVATLAVLSADRGAVDTLTWSEVDTSTHRPSVEKGIYRQADVHCDWSDETQDHRNASRRCPGQGWL